MAWYNGEETTGTIQQEKEEEGKEREKIGKERRWKEKEEVTERRYLQLIVSYQPSLNFGIK